jgi:hypothetical protein
MREACIVTPPAPSLKRGRTCSCHTNSHTHTHTHTVCFFALCNRHWFNTGHTLSHYHTITHTNTGMKKEGQTFMQLIAAHRWRPVAHLVGCTCLVWEEERSSGGAHLAEISWGPPDAHVTRKHLTLKSKVKGSKGIISYGFDNGEIAGRSLASDYS